MTAIVSRERAKATALTGAAGVLLLMAAFVMMLAAAPKQAQHRPAAPPVTQLTTDLCRQLTPGNASTSARACLAGPSAPSAWAEPYPPGRGSRLPTAAR
jgi:hypothetical protein